MDDDDAAAAYFGRGVWLGPEQVSELERLLWDLADDLAIYIDNEHPHRDKYPIEQLRWDRDMALVERARDRATDLGMHRK